MTLILFRTRKQLDRMARKDALHETRHRGQVLAKYALITTQRELSIKLIQLLVALRDKELPFITQRTHLDGESIPSGDYLWARTYDENDDINAKHRYLYKIFIPRYDMKNLWIQVWTDENNTVLFSGSHFRPFDEKNNYAKDSELPADGRNRLRHQPRRRLVQQQRRQPRNTRPGRQREDYREVGTQRD